MKTMFKPLVFVIGDSISIQYGPFLEKYLKGRFLYARKTDTGEAFENLDIPQGANGGDSSMVLGYLKYNHDKGQLAEADYLLINCGLHDIKTNPESGHRQIPPALYRENLDKILSFASHFGRQIVWIRTTPCDDKIHNSRQQEFYRFKRDVEEYNRIADEVMNYRAVPIVDLFNFTETLGFEAVLYSDHIHFTVHVQKMQAAFIAGWLNSFNQQYKWSKYEKTV